MRTRTPTSPARIGAVFDHAHSLLRANRPEEALCEARELRQREPENPFFRALEISALEAMEHYEASTGLWRELLAAHPGRPEWWLGYGHALRALGRRQECMDAYRKALEIDPGCGGAWWSLADLKTFRFGEYEVGEMEAWLAKAGSDSENRIRLHFALGKAFADLGCYQKSFANYSRGNALQRLGISHDPGILTSYVARSKEVFTAEFFAARSTWGSANRDPVFLVGMPRAGSTLVEQMLASHSQIEGTRELSDLATISRELQGRFARTNSAAYPAALGELDADELRSLAERYLERVRAHRKSGRPRFIDKMGANFVHVGLIRLILPNAKIIDVRRHPLACCFSIFAQLFPKGQNDSYRLSDIASSYRNYVELMSHFDRVLPGWIHRIHYEQLIAEPEMELRRLLDYLELPFEAACLEFYRTDRVVTTASAEQVRRPLYREGLDTWRHYEPWLGPLKTALGPVLDSYAGASGQSSSTAPSADLSGPSHSS